MKKIILILLVALMTSGFIFTGVAQARNFNWNWKAPQVDWSNFSWREFPYDQEKYNQCVSDIEDVRNYAQDKLDYLLEHPRADRAYDRWQNRFFPARAEMICKRYAMEQPSQNDSYSAWRFFERGQRRIGWIW